jgi:isoleucyl-tRNA synthetase
MLFGSIAFKNVICHGLILDEKGQKMSKSKGNVVDPWDIIREFGADALRWYIYISAPPEADRRFGPNLVRETVRDYFLTLWNVYSFFVTYANLDRPNLKSPPPPKKRPELDRWLLARMQDLIQKVTEALEAYDPTTSSRALRDFVVEDLSQWYVRRGRRRYWKNEDALDRGVGLRHPLRGPGPHRQALRPLHPLSGRGPLAELGEKRGRRGQRKRPPGRLAGGGPGFGGRGAGGQDAGGA